MSRNLWISVLSAFLFVYLSPAQTPDTATIRGHVTDSAQAAVSGARITAVNSLTGIERATQTGVSGEFSLPGLPAAGTWRIGATKEGFAEAAVSGLQLTGGRTADVDLRLNVASGRTAVTVTGVAGEVHTDQPQIGIHLTSQDAENVPLLGSKISYLPLLNAANRPAINQGDVFMNQNMFTTNGAGRRQTTFVVDGTTANDAWGRQTMFSNPPLSSVQEMDVLTNAFSAEFGGSTGSVVNVVTRSGGNQFHGEIGELWRPNATAATLSGFTAQNATSGNNWTSDSLGQSSASLSGPLGSSSRTHFSAAGEFTRENRGSPVISPVAPGIFVGHYRDWLGFLRVDHQINDNHTLFLRGNMDGFYDTNPNGAVGGNNLPTVDRIFRRRTYSEELGETAVLGPNLINNLRLQFQLASPITEFDPLIYETQYQVPISTGGTFTSGTSQSALLLNHQYQFNDTLSAVHGRHQLKFGADVVFAHSGGNSKEFGGPIYLGQFVYKPCTGTLASCESQTYLGDINNVRTYTQSYGNATYTVDDTLWALFAQDDFHVRPDLTLNLGLRYERQTFSDSTKDFAPRLGFAYNLHNSGHTVIRGGFGIYYSQLVDNMEANWALTGPTGVFNYTASPGQVGFPASVSAAPLGAFPAGAAAPLRSLYIRPGESAYLNQFFPTSTLVGYPSKLLSPYSGQWTIGVEQRLAAGWLLAVDYVGSRTSHINRPRDVDPPSPFIRTAQNQIRSAQAANCTRPYWIWWYATNGLTCNTTTATNPQPSYAVIQSDLNDGYANYNALDANLTRRFSNHLSMLVSYTWSHALDNVDPDIPGQNPNDANFTGRVEYANAIFDQRHRFVWSGVYVLPMRVSFGWIATLATGLPYNWVTGTTNSGDNGATTDRPVVNGVVVARNLGRGESIYDVSPFLERPFTMLAERVHVTPRVEAFNAFNHANFVGYSGTYGTGDTPGAGFGAPLVGVTNQLPARSLQFRLTIGF